MDNGAKYGIRRFLELYKLYAKMDLSWLLRDRLFAILTICCDIISNISSITGIYLLAWRFGGIGGMNRYEVLLMLAYTTLVTGIYQTFFSSCNTGHISRRIGRGQLEHMFIQPLPMPVQLLAEGFIPFTGSSNILTGSVIMCIALSKLNVQVTWWWILSLVGNLLITVVIIVASSYLASSVTFVYPVQAEEISTFVVDTIGSLSEFPLSGMPKVVQFPLLTVIPAGLLGWFPTLALLGKPPLGLPTYYPLAITLILSVAAAYLFRKGLNYYVKKGINRYLSYGHRR